MADWTKLRGWKYDHHNSYLEVWVDGTEVARFDDVATYGLRLLSNGLDITAGGITVTSGAIDHSDTTASTSTTTGAIKTAGGIGIAGALYVNDDVSVIDEIVYYNQLVHANATDSVRSTDTDLDANDAGKVIECATDSVTFTLPATTVGLTLTIVNTGADGTCGIYVDPNASDLIKGCDIDGSDGQYIVNTKATHIQGDMVQLTADSGVGWYITKMTGTWDTES